jgi:hypothetical protein
MKMAAPKEKKCPWELIKIGTQRSYEPQEKEKSSTNEALEIKRIRKKII